MKSLEARKAEIEMQVGAVGASPVIQLHPNMADVYRRKVAELELALNDGSINAEVVTEASRIF